MGNKVDYSAAFQLHGKVAIVTGAGGNLGAEMCAALSAVGASVIATDVNEQAVKVVADRLNAEGGAVTATAHDVTVESEWEAAVALAISTYGGLDVVVNAAAIVPPSRPVIATTFIPRSCAASMAANTFFELPLVEMARRTSPALPRALTCFENISLKS